ncbi:MAG: WD40 repeat domain-containing protein [Bacteroidia bacterium]|nr:WD40 repeat domain-containing protein [Bacteroidia bacterium]
MKSIFFLLIILYQSLFIFVFSQPKQCLQLLHEKPVLSVEYSPDGKSVASVCTDKTIKIWDAETGKLLQTLNDMQEGEISISFSPNGKYLASGSWDSSVKLWDINSNKIVRKFTGHEKALRSVDFHPSGEFIASAGWDAEIIIWYIQSDLLFKKFIGHNQCIRSVKFSPDGRYLASGGYDLMLKVWDFITGEVIDSVEAHKYPIEAIDYSPDGRYIATGSIDNTIKIWDSSNLNLIAILKGHSEGVASVDFSPDGKLLASASNDKSMKIWDIGTRKILYTISGHSLPVKAVAFDPSGKNIANGSTDKIVNIYDISNLNIIPAEKIIPSQIKMIENNQALTWLSPPREKFDVLERDFTLKLLINDKTITRYRLFINKVEYIEFDGIQKYIPKPNILNYNEKTPELEYNIYLHDGENEIQVFGESAYGAIYYLSNIINIFCHDFSNLSNNPDLYITTINIPSYTDKKLNSGYIPDDVNKYISQLKTQQQILFKSLIINQLDCKELTTKSSIEETIVKTMEKPKENDIFFLYISAHLAGTNDGIFLLPQEMGIKSEMDQALSFEFLLNNLKVVKSYIIIIINAGHQFSKIKSLISPTVEYISDEIIEKLGDKEEYSALLLSETSGKEICTLIADSFKKENDKDNNQAIDIFEMKEFLEKKMQVSLIHKGNALPLFIFLEP